MANASNGMNDTAAAAGSPPGDSGDLLDSGDIGRRIDQMDSKIDRMDSKIDRMDSKIDLVGDEMRTGFAQMHNLFLSTVGKVFQVERNGVCRALNANSDLITRLEPIERIGGGYPANFPESKSKFLLLPEEELIRLLQEYELPIGEGREAQLRTLAEFFGFRF